MKRILAMGLLFGLLAACGDDDEKTASNNTNNTNNSNNSNNTNNTNNTNNSNNGAASASFVTYNAGLADGFVPLAAERRQPVADALSGLEADVVCLQEVWLNQDEMGQWQQDYIDAVLAATQTNLPHSYYFISEDETEVSCQPADVVDIDACVTANCADATADTLQDCVLGSCRDEFFALPQPCSQCLVGQLGNEYEDIKAACVGGAQSAFYSNAHNGLMLLSKYPLSNTSHEKFYAVQTARSVLKADVALPGGSQRVYCTHLTADITATQYPAVTGVDIASYEEEQAKQIDDMAAMIAAEARNVIVMGDMNTGPVGANVVAELPANWAKFEALGWVSAYIEAGEYSCTYCEGNSLVDETGDRTIDHVFSTDDSWTVRSAELIFTETVDIAGTMHNLSDHYGVKATMSLSAE
jgi:endonuclease/exonuclease/phosphatase family metal-dependent hydrolase